MNAYEYTVIHAPYRPWRARWVAEERRRYAMPVRVSGALVNTGLQLVDTVRKTEVPWRWMAAILCRRWFLARHRELTNEPKTTTLYRLEAP
jgi:hypothetical protein